MLPHFSFCPVAVKNTAEHKVNFRPALKPAPKTLVDRIKEFCTQTVPKTAERVKIHLGFEPIKVFSISVRTDATYWHGHAIVRDCFTTERLSELSSANMEWYAQQGLCEMVFKVNRPELLNRPCPKTLRSLHRQFQKQGYDVRQVILPFSGAEMVHYLD